MSFLKFYKNLNRLLLKLTKNISLKKYKQLNVAKK